MSEVSFIRDLECGRDRIRELLVDHDFLASFVKDQHPVDNHVSVTIDAGSSTLDWGVSTDGIPGVFRGLVGETIPVSLVVTCPGATADQAGSMNLDLKGKISGQLRASLSLLAVEQDMPHTVLAVRGRFDIQIGPLSGMASNKARDHLIIPILGELAKHLERWSAGRPALTDARADI